LATSTVREALEFSALLRQPRKIPKAEKLAYVDEILKLLDMTDYQHAVVGELGEGQSIASCLHSQAFVDGFLSLFLRTERRTAQKADHRS
jgi:ABC-type Mn2+/Zn2+ transport system ATPase subunit